MTRLTPITHSEFIRRIKNFGFKGPFAGGNHLFMIKNSLRITIPNPHRKEIGPDLLLRLLRQAGITRDEWLEQ